MEMSDFRYLKIKKFLRFTIFKYFHLNFIYSFLTRWSIHFLGKVPGHICVRSIDDNNQFFPQSASKWRTYLSIYLSNSKIIQTMKNQMQIQINVGLRRQIRMSWSTSAPLIANMDVLISSIRKKTKPTMYLWDTKGKMVKRRQRKCNQLLF